MNNTKKYTTFSKKRSSKFEVLSPKPAFTLIEILVSMVIMAMIFSGTLYGFWKILEANARIDLSRQLQKEMHFAMIRMADKIRDYSIDYNAYTSGPGKACENQDVNSPPSLCVKNNYVFSADTEVLKMNDAPLLSSRFVTKKLYFSITPNTDPSDISNPQFQPKVTIFLEAESKFLPDVSIPLQTTISSRIYN